MNTVRLQPQLQEKLRRVAKKKGISLSEVHRQALESYCDAELVDKAASRYDDVAGASDGPADLAETVSRRYLEAMAEKHGRHAR